MKMRRLVLPFFYACAHVSTPALADVKAGVDAWSRGEFDAAVKEWQVPATQGDADAQFNLAQAYKWGRGVKQDLKQAELLYGQAAAKGHLRASDEYGLMLFDRGERTDAMPYIKAAAERGDPRAQYVLGIACFNGDLAPKDWVRAYALMSLARSAGLPQAGVGIQQMDSFIPLAQRQQAVALAQQIATDAEATRNRQLVAADLGAAPDKPGASAAQGARVVPAPLPAPNEAVTVASQIASGSSPRTAGADFARPATAAVAVPAKPVPPAPNAATTPARVEPATASAAKPLRPAIATKPVSTAPAVKPSPAMAASGKWRIQLGAFGLAANADALWSKLRVRPEISGHPRVNVPAGSVTKLQAGGFSHDAANAVCGKLSAAGFVCLPVGD